MKYILYENGRRLGEVSEWLFSQKPPEYKTVLGKTFLSVPGNDQCTFISPKPVNRKRSYFIVVENENPPQTKPLNKNQTSREIQIQILKVVGGTSVIAKILGS